MAKKYKYKPIRYCINDSFTPLTLNNVHPNMMMSCHQISRKLGISEGVIDKFESEDSFPLLYYTSFDSIIINGELIPNGGCQYFKGDVLDWLLLQIKNGNFILTVKEDFKRLAEGERVDRRKLYNSKN